MDAKITTFALIAAVIITCRNIILEQLDAKYKYKKEKVRVSNLKKNMNIHKQM